jgi:hypothetical protein
VSALLRSQAGVGEVVEPYPNLHKGQIRLKPSNDKPFDLPELVRLLEKQAGFAPVTEVELELRGRVARRNGRLVIEVAETGQGFEIAKNKSGRPLSEGESVDVRGVLENVRSGGRLKILAWTAGAPKPPDP